jgi:hypothetical protein
MFKIALAILITLASTSAFAANHQNRAGTFPTSPYSTSREAPEVIYNQLNWTGTGSGNDAGIRANLRRDPFSDRR